MSLSVLGRGFHVNKHRRCPAWKCSEPSLLWEPFAQDGPCKRQQAYLSRAACRYRNPRFNHESLQQPEENFDFFWPNAPPFPVLGSPRPLLKKSSGCPSSFTYLRGGKETLFIWCALHSGFGLLTIFTSSDAHPTAFASIRTRGDKFLGISMVLLLRIGRL